LTFLRPTLIFGAHDPHNGYGPNKFLRSSHFSNSIDLFGEGEELRDHVYIDDVANLVHQCILFRTSGPLNAVTGKVYSFKEIAEKIIKITNSNTTINNLQRTLPMPHNGYRSFDNSNIFRLFPEFEFTSLDYGLASAYRLEFDNA